MGAARKFEAGVFYTTWGLRVVSLRRNDSAAIGGRADSHKATAGPHARGYPTRADELGELESQSHSLSG